ncbi:MAG: glycosyl hydrolase, partial [Verrucomicrobiota bacterium]
MTRKLIGVTVAAVMLGGMAAFAADELERGFRNPPDSAKPYTSSWWMNGNVTKEGITADLEAMKRVGLGGFLLLQTSWHTPPGPATFMGEKWREMIAHAVAEAGRLGLGIGMHNCAGWSSSGGPWIT